MTNHNNNNYNNMPLTSLMLSVLIWLQIVGITTIRVSLNVVFEAIRKVFISKDAISTVWPSENARSSVCVTSFEKISKLVGSSESSSEDPSLITDADDSLSVNDISYAKHDKHDIMLNF